MSGLLLLAWLAPLVGAALAASRRLYWLPVAAPLPSLAAAALIPAGVELEIPWLLLGTVLGLDDISRVFLAFTALLWMAAGLYVAGSTGDPHAGRFRTLFLLAMSGNLWLIVGQDLVSFYVGFSVMGLAAYGLVIHEGDRAALRAGKVYLAMTLAGELFLLAALVLIAEHAGSLTPQRPDLVGLGDAAIGLLLAGLAIKAGLVPLHVWLPLAHPAAPVPASAVLSGAMLKVAILGWLRFLPVGEEALVDWGTLLVFMGLLSVFFAVPIGLVQSNPKVILAYSSISKMGLLTLTLGVILLQPDLAGVGILALALYAAHHALVKGGLFLGVGLRHHGTMQPLVLAGTLVLALSLAGLPWTAGAVVKAEIKPILAGGGWVWLTGAVAVGTTATVLLMARFLWVIWRTEPHPAPGYLPGWIAWAGLLGLSLLFPLLLGDRESLGTNAIPAAVGLALVLPFLLAAWLRPGLVRPAVDLVRPGDILGLLRPLPHVLTLVGRVLARPRRRLTAAIRRTGEGMLTALKGGQSDPEQGLRRWPIAGTAWLGATALLFALTVWSPSPQPTPEPAPSPAPSPGEVKVTPQRRAAPDPGPVASGEVALPAAPQAASRPQPSAPEGAAPASQTPGPDADSESGPVGRRGGTAITAPSAAAEPALSGGRDLSGELGPEQGHPGPSSVPALAERRQGPPESETPAEQATGPSSAGPDGSAETPALSQSGRERRGGTDAALAASGPQVPAVCDPQRPFVMTHPAMGEPLHLRDCEGSGDEARRIDAPPLTNALVEMVQRHLADLGYDPGPLDGLIGPRTRDAIRRFQRDHGHAETGRISFDLLRSIRSVTNGSGVGPELAPAAHDNEKT